MARISAVNVATAATLVVLAVFTLYRRDTGTLVPPPEAVAEGFIRQLASHRVRQTRQFLSEDARVRLPPDHLSDWFDRVEGTTGAVHSVQGTSQVGTDNTARAEMIVRGSRQSAAMSVRLVREYGLWRVSDLPVLRTYQ